MGNGFPVAAVVSTADLVDPFMEATDYFSTFGGGTVACAAGLAVLRAVEQEGLVANAQTVGGHLTRLLGELAAGDATVAAPRSWGLAIGVDVHSDDAGSPAADVAGGLVDRMRERGVLIGLTGSCAIDAEDSAPAGLLDRTRRPTGHRAGGVLAGGPRLVLVHFARGAAIARFALVCETSGAGSISGGRMHTDRRRILAAALGVGALIASGLAVTSTSAVATAPGRNGRIAFVRAGEVWTAAKTGAHQVKLTKSQHTASHPKWSPDGGRIAYQRGDSIWVMRADGSHKARLWKGAAPSWSPDGRQLAYIGHARDPQGCKFAEVDVRNLDGSNRTVIDDLGAQYCPPTPGEMLRFGPTTTWSNSKPVVYFGVEIQTENQGAFTVVSAVLGAPADGSGVTSGSGSKPLLLTLNSVTVAHPPSLLATVDSVPNSADLVYSIPYKSDNGVRSYRVTMGAEDDSAFGEISPQKFASYPVSAPDQNKVLYVVSPPGVQRAVYRCNLNTQSVVRLIANATQPDWQPLP